MDLRIFLASPSSRACAGLNPTTVSVNIMAAMHAPCLLVTTRFIAASFIILSFDTVETDWLCRATAQHPIDSDQKDSQFIFSYAGACTRSDDRTPSVCRAIISS